MASNIGTVATVTQIPDGDQAWVGLDNLASNDNVYATCTRNGTGLFANANGAFQPNSLQIDFNFPNVPVDSDFLGMVVSVGRFRGRLFSGCQDGIVRLTIDGIPVGDNRAAGAWPLNEATEVYGGNNDPWGAPIDLDDVVASGQTNRIGLRFQPTNCSNETISVDFVVANIFYRWSDIYVQQNSTWVRSYPEIQQAGVMRPPISASVFKDGAWQTVYLG